MSGVLILGAGGHAGVIAEIFQARGEVVLGLLDDTRPVGETRLGLPVLGGIDSFADHGANGLIIGIGSNVVRKAVVQRLGEAAAGLWVNAVHPTSWVSPSARLGCGIVVGPLAVVHTAASIGHHTIVNTAASVDHDCELGNYVHIAPGARLAGHVHIGDGALVGVGAAVIPTVQIGAGCTVGAGAVVLSDVPADCTVVGNPARFRQTSLLA